MTAETLTAVAGLVLSLLFSYVPGLNGWFDALESTYKRIIMLVLLIVVAGGAYALACVGASEQLGLAVTCDYEGGVVLARVFIAALVANQAAYAITKG